MRPSVSGSLAGHGACCSDGLMMIRPLDQDTGSAKVGCCVGGARCSGMQLVVRSAGLLLRLSDWNADWS